MSATDDAIERLLAALKLLNPERDEPAYSVLFGQIVEMERWRRTEREVEVAKMSPTDLWNRIQCAQVVLRSMSQDDHRVRWALGALEGLDGPLPLRDAS